MNKVFILKRYFFDDVDIMYVSSTLEKAREKAKELGWVIESDGFCYRTPERHNGEIIEWEVDE